MRPTMAFYMIVYFAVFCSFSWAQPNADEQVIMHTQADVEKARDNALASIAERVNLWKAWPGRDDNKQSMIENFASWVARRNQAKQEFTKNRSLQGSSSIYFEFQNIRQIGTVRSVGDNLGDYLSYDAETQCLILTRDNEHGFLAEGAFLSLAQYPWRTIEFLCYPNGTPHLMECFEDGLCKGLSVVWDETGKVVETVFDCVPAGDPRLYPEVTPDTPPSGLPGGGKALPNVQTCVVRLCFSSTDSTDKQPAVWLLRYAVQRGAALNLEAPGFTELNFVGWSGDASEANPRITIVLDRDKTINAHYSGEVRFPDKALEMAVREILAKPKGIITPADAIQITQFNASGKNIEDLSGLHWLKRLTMADLSGNKISELSSLDPFLNATKWLVIPGLTAPGNPNDSSWIKRLKYFPMNRLSCLANCVHCFQSLNKLVLDDNPIIKLPEMAACMNLREFSANNCTLLDIGGLKDCKCLETLHVDKNQLQTIPSFPLFPALKEVYARDNRISLLTPPSEPQTFTLHLDGNPLSDRFLDKCLPDMEAKGITVIMTIGDDVPGADADPDQDGYSNSEERRFAKLFFADEEKVNELYNKAIQDPNTPSRYLTLLPESLKKPKTDPKSVASIPTQSISIDIDGNGSIYPGPGERTFATYIIHDDLTWDFNQLTFTAKPAPGWALQVDKIMAQIGKSVDENGQMTVSLKDHVGFVHARFVQVGDVVALDLVGDLESFLKATGLSNDVCAFDRNKMEISSAADFFVPNGIPDAAEFKVLETVLKSPKAGSSRNGGIYHEYAVKAWRENLALAKRDLGEHGDVPGAINTLTAYSTLGNYESMEFIKQTLNRLYHLKIDMGKYNNDLMEELDPDHSAANTAITNKEHWDRISRGKPITKELFAEYANAVLKGD